MESLCYAYDFAVIGGDMRQVYLAGELARDGRKVCHYALCQETACGYQADLLSQACDLAPSIICPIPMSKNGNICQSALSQALPIEQLLAHLRPGQTFFAGCVPDGFKEEAIGRGVRVVDLMEDTGLALFNTLATAEGAICEAIKRSPINLHKSRCAVLGYGKCGCTLVSYLKGMFCQVQVFSEQDGERARAALVADGAGDLSALEKSAGDYDFIFNTIPARVVDAGILGKMKPSVTIIDIASAPGGVDLAAAEGAGRDAVLCPGLPGKYAPSSSAGAIKEVIEKVLYRRSEE